MTTNKKVNKKQVEHNKKASNKILTPKVLISGEKADLLGLTEPVHMCSNCWNNKVNVNR